MYMYMYIYIYISCIQISERSIERIRYNSCCDEEYEKVFPDAIVIDFKNNKHLKSHLMIAILLDITEIDILK